MCGKREKEGVCFSFDSYLWEFSVLMHFYWDSDSLESF